MEDIDFIARSMKIDEQTRQIADAQQRLAERRRRRAALHAEYDEDRRAERRKLAARYGVDVDALDTIAPDAMLADAEAELGNALDE